ncbi:hypothetical protein DPMN_113448 [Dreissena polymorpha]|uniref:Myb/SANT-like DNA-binding domain-containing protein n=1 Tax=Dreissena polymorpha TaxID=45954 RepID=A0A9D4KHG5_DREPO|nr:hypothetical protein DPMN_113448 [Dreissena polymorpha]
MADLVKNRSASWQPRELEELLEGVQQNYEVLWGKLSGTLSKKDKDRAWSDIVQSINSVGGNERNVEDSMKKWCDWKSRTIMKDAKRRRFVESSGEAALPKKMQLTVLEDKCPKQSCSECKVEGSIPVHSRDPCKKMIT